MVPILATFVTPPPPGAAPALGPLPAHADGPVWAAGLAAAAAGGLAWVWAAALRRRVRRQAAELRAHYDRAAALEAQLRQAQKMEAVGQLAGGIAHDFNNLLTVINGCGELLKAAVPAGSPAHALAEDVCRAGHRAAALTAQLLTFGQRRTFQLAAVDLNAVLADAGPLLARAAGDRVRVVAAPGHGVPVVRADPEMIRQVLLNLAANAGDAMPAGGTLTVATARAGGDRPAARLTVTDTGCGMDAATQAKAFEPFFTTKPVGRGAGLGLSAVYGIVRTLGGSVRLTSAVGAGTTVEIDLPADPAVGETDVDIATPVFGAGGATVLLVEDDPGVRRMLDLALERSGFRVIVAETPEAALAACREHGDGVDLLLTDVLMPGMTGRELAERVRAARPGIRVLLMSGYTPDEGLRQGVLAGEWEFLPKPFAPADLIAKVRAVLNGDPPAATSSRPSSAPPSSSPG